METVTITVNNVPEPFELNFEDMTWHAGHAFPEGEFPLIAEVDGKRYEVYSDGTFAEEELP
jgi:hypothetical protein